MAKLFFINNYELSPHDIAVNTSEGMKFVNREKFEAWIDRDNKRQGASWDIYYDSCAPAIHLYDYLVIRQGSQNFNIQNGIDKIR